MGLIGMVNFPSNELVFSLVVAEIYPDIVMLVRLISVIVKVPESNRTKVKLSVNMKPFISIPGLPAEGVPKVDITYS